MSSVGRVKQVAYAEGEVISAPSTSPFFTSTGFNSYASEAAFVTAKGSAAAVGDSFFDTTAKCIKVYDGSWRSVGKRYRVTDTTGWTGAVSTVTYDVSSITDSASSMNWVLKKSASNEVQVLADIDFPTSTSVRVTVDIPLESGTYILQGV